MGVRWMIFVSLWLSLFGREYVFRWKRPLVQYCRPLLTIVILDHRNIFAPIHATQTRQST